MEKNGSIKVSPDRLASEWQGPSLEELQIALLAEIDFAEAQGAIVACEHCADNATVPFDYLLDALTGCDPTVTEHLMPRPAICPNCHHEILEKDLVLVS